MDEYYSDHSLDSNVNNYRDYSKQNGNMNIRINRKEQQYDNNQSSEV